MSEGHKVWCLSNDYHGSKQCNCVALLSGEPECCHEWVMGEKSLLALCQIGSIHGTPYTGSAFKFCPWCGVSRQSDKLTRHNN